MEVLSRDKLAWPSGVGDAAATLRTMVDFSALTGKANASPAEQKDAVSHRGKALRQLVEILAQLAD